MGRRAAVAAFVTAVLGLGFAVAAQAEPAAFLSGVAGLTARSGVGGTVDARVAPARPVKSSALSSDDPPSEADQISTLEAAETKINNDISTYGASNAYYDMVPLADVWSFNLYSLWNQGIDGAGTTVAVIEGWADPNIQSVIDTWDSDFGLPDPQITTIYPAGALPAQCPAGMEALGAYGDCDAWAGPESELDLDVEAVHLLAPYAKIVISATPADTEIQDDASSQIAPPEMMKALEYISNNHLANVISISDGSNESDYSNGPAEIHAQDPGELTAAAAGIPVAVATGDCGAAQELATGDGFCNDLTPGPAAGTWDDSPFTIAVGGNTPAFSLTGPSGQDSFSVWNVPGDADGPGAAEGASLSSVYGIPDYQSGVESIIGAPWRAMPDITMDAQDGTSMAAPEFAAVLALATQVHGGNLGSVNDALYDDLGPEGLSAGIVDITQGNNNANGVTGYSAGPGYDIATGWGTVNAGSFVPALAQAVSQVPQNGSTQQEAEQDLTALETTGHVSPSIDKPTDSLTVTSTGFLPEHPVTVSVDSQQVSTVDADGNADLDFTLPLASLGLQPGPHTIELQGMLLSQNIPFTVAANTGTTSNTGTGTTSTPTPLAATVTRAPKLTGKATIRSRISVLGGSYANAGAVTVTFERCQTKCKVVQSGASTTYKLQNADAGSFIIASVFVPSSDGGASATAKATGLIGPVISASAGSLKPRAGTLSLKTSSNKPLLAVTTTITKAKQKKQPSSYKLTLKRATGLKNTISAWACLLKAGAQPTCTAIKNANNGRTYTVKVPTVDTLELIATL
jgi:subtilase family serine protease